jgi:hypothetical protein
MSSLHHQKTFIIAFLWMGLGLLSGLWTVSAGIVRVSDEVFLEIPDGDLAGTLVRIEVSDVPVGQGIRDLNVILSVDGTVGFNGDLFAYLTKTDNSGFSILMNRVGREPNNQFGSAGAGLKSLVFDDEATDGDIHFYETVIGESAIFGLPWTGSWQPDGRLVDPALITGAEARGALLDQFDGIDPNGEWLLFLADVSPGGLLTLTDWSLEFELDAVVSPFAGVASDGLVAGGTVFFDANLNGNLDAPEPWVLTNAQGDYQLNVLPGPFDQNGDNQLQASEGVLVLKGGTDIATGLPLEISFRAPLGATVIHPVTTLIAALLIRDPNLSAVDAESQVESALGLDAGLAARVDMLTFDMFAEAALGNVDAVAIINAVAKVQDTVIQVGDFVSGGNGLPRIPAIELAFEQLVNEVVAGRSLTLTSVSRLREIIDAVDATLFNSLSEKQKDAAAEIVVANNALKQSFAESGQTVSTMVQQIVQTQVQSQSEIASDLRAAASGQLALQDAIAKNTYANLKSAVEGAPVGDLQGNVTSVGTFSFDQAAYEVKESGSGIHPITVVRENGNAGTVRLLVTPSRGTADDTDFVDVPIEVDFAPLEIRKTIDTSVLIQNDALAEGAENMELSLGLRAGHPQGAAIGTDRTALLSIIDDDTVGSVSFTPEQFVIREDGVVISPITLVRSEGSSGILPVVVRLESIPNSASAGSDFIGGDFLVTFGDGNLNQLLDAVIIDNNVFESDEEFRAELRLAPGAPAGASLGAITSVTVTIQEDDPNHPPTISQIANQRLNEDQVLSQLAFTLADEEHDVSGLILSVTSSDSTLFPASGLVMSGSGASRSLLVRPAHELSGAGDITIRVDDGFTSTEMTFSVEVTLVNDPPEIFQLDDVEVFSGAGVVLMEYLIGDRDSSSDALRATFESQNPSLIPTLSIESVGTEFRRTIRITTPDSGSGSVNVLMTIQDESTSISRRFTITVIEGEPPPNPLTLDAINNVIVAEDTPIRIPVSIGVTGTLAGPLSYTIISDSGSLLPSGSVSVEGEAGEQSFELSPSLNQSGQAEVIFSVTDGLNVASRSFQLSVLPIDDPPFFEVGEDVSIEEDGIGLKTIRVSDVDTPLSELTIDRLSSDRTSLLPDEGLSWQLTDEGLEIRLAPAPDQSGDAVVLFRVADETSAIESQFAVTVVAVNDPPVISRIDPIRHSEGTRASVTFTTSDVDSRIEDLRLTIESLNEPLLPEGSFGIEGEDGNHRLVIEPRVGLSGVGTLLLKVTDGLLQSEQTISVTVTPVDDPPFLAAIAPIEMLEDTETTIEFEFGDPDTIPSALTLVALSSNEILFPIDGLSVEGEAPSGRLIIRPAADGEGAGIIEIVVSDGLSSVKREVQVSVIGINDEPTISGLKDVVLSENEEKLIQFEISDPDSPLERLLVSVASTNPSLIPAAKVLVKGVGTQRQITLIPVKGQQGKATILIGASDGQKTSVSQFDVVVGPATEEPIETLIRISKSSNGVVVQWEGGGILQTSTDIEGPYLSVSWAKSPFSLPAPLGGERYFRVVAP